MSCAEKEGKIELLTSTELIFNGAHLVAGFAPGDVHLFGVVASAKDALIYVKVNEIRQHFLSKRLIQIMSREREMEREMDLFTLQMEQVKH